MKLDQMKRQKELGVENGRLRKAVSDLTLDKLILREAARAGGACIEHVQQGLQVSEHRARAALGQHPSSQRKAPRGRRRI